MSRRGAVLFEVLLSLGLFVGAAAFALGATRSVLDGIERTRRRSVAVDLARSKLAELEAGLITIADLRDAAEGIDRVGSIDSFAEPDGALIEPEAWEVDVSTERTEFTGLALVELTVRETLDAVDGDDRAVEVTLRQLMRLRDADAGEYELDEILRDLPAEDGR